MTFVSQHAVNLFLEPLRSVHICDDSVRIRTDTTLDQDCVLKATVHVCTACMIVSLLTTCLNLNTNRKMKKNEKKASTGYLPETAQKIISFKEKLQEIVQQFRSQKKKLTPPFKRLTFFTKKKRSAGLR